MASTEVPRDFVFFYSLFNALISSITSGGTQCGGVSGFAGICFLPYA